MNFNVHQFRIVESNSKRSQVSISFIESKDTPLYVRMWKGEISFFELKKLDSFKYVKN
jgi:hypothetical protein